MRRRVTTSAQDDLFSVDPAGHLMHALEAASWPAHEQFPFNRAGASVRSVVREDLASSPRPVIVAGYSSIAELVDFVADWDERAHGGIVRVVLGTEPYPTARFSFSSATAAFTEEVRRYWQDQGISLRLSAKVLQAIAALDAGRLRCRFIHGTATLHAKVYVGHDAATVGSSNFTPAGLAGQIEANARFERRGEPVRYEGLATIVENLWAQAQPWDDELRALLEELLRATTWQEALVQACADLLEGEWAARYLDAATGVGATLWPSQRSGIAQALWIIETVGSALVADATGSGKTRMGAHLVRAARDRLWSTGRARRDLAVVVCPPSVEHTWEREANKCGVNIRTVSHGLLSRASEFGPRSEEEAVGQAQILAVDEAHNFLNPAARRTRQVRESGADHVLLFTATPINRGPADLLQLVGFLGADNFEDESLEVLRRLDRRRRTAGDHTLSPAEAERLRREIQRFTVRRTKAMLNEAVEREPDAYVHPETDKVCRYPRHDARLYDTDETAEDEAVAEGIRSLAIALTGVAQLERVVAVPAALRSEYTDDRWLAFRLTSVRGLAAHHVLSAMRSSRAAVVEHLVGTAAASERFGLGRFKPTPTGNVIDKLDRLGAGGPPQVNLDCEIPAWLADGEAWQAACEEERQRYVAMAAAAADLSAAREAGKAALLGRLAAHHDRVLAFDRHPATLEQLRLALVGIDAGVEVVVATGTSTTERRLVERLFERSSSKRAIALCSEAMNEGLNLQGASAIVHLDLPTTLRIAEQRVGRVDRMDSPHEVIEAWWPNDGPAFATRAGEVLAQRAAESAQLLGSNLQVPFGPAGGDVIDVRDRIAEAEAPGAEEWDGIRDALEPVRSLVSGERALVSPGVYDELRADGRTRVLSVVRANTPWAFLAVASTADGPPRWLFLDGAQHAPVVALEDIADRLRARLADDPPSVGLEAALAPLNRALDAAALAEHMLLPRRLQRALQQLERVTTAYAVAAQGRRDEATATRWRKIARLAEQRVTERRPDPYAVAERWIALVRPHVDAERARRRHQQFILLRDVDQRLVDDPIDPTSVEAALADLTAVPPLDERVVACIIGVVQPSQPSIPVLRSGAGPSQ